MNVVPYRKYGTRTQICERPNWPISSTRAEKMWKLQATLLEKNRRTDLPENKKITKASDLKIDQLAFVKYHQKGTFDPTYIYDHRVSGILNDSMVVLTNPDGKEKKCNIHHFKLMTLVDTSTNTFNQFQDSIRKTPCNTT